MDIKDVTTDPRQAVDNGIAFFGNNYANWREKLKDGFHVAMGDVCPLSKVTGMHYDAAVKELQKDANWAVHHGFLYGNNFGYAELQEIWEEKLTD